MFSWLRSRRRRNLIAEPFPLAWRAALKEYVRHYAYLDPLQRSRLEGFIQVLAVEKDWVGGNGFALTDAMKVTIAGYAGIMTLGLDEPYYFDRLTTIVVYPTGYMPRYSRFAQYVPPVPASPRLGEAHHHGPVVVSWEEIVSREKLRPGNNLVIHEFTHHVDGLDGFLDGAPPIPSASKESRWNRVTAEEFARLGEAAARGEPTLLDPYGASNRAEFFAVASECFFERPRALRARHAELYGVLSDFYLQDPAAWLPDAIPSAPGSTGW